MLHLALLGMLLVHTCNSAPGDLNLAAPAPAPEVVCPQPRPFPRPTVPDKLQCYSLVNRDVRNVLRRESVLLSDFSWEPVVLCEPAPACLAVPAQQLQVPCQIGVAPELAVPWSTGFAPKSLDSFLPASRQLAYGPKPVYTTNGTQYLGKSAEGAPVCAAYLHAPQPGDCQWPPCSCMCLCPDCPCPCPDKPQVPDPVASYNLRLGHTLIGPNYTFSNEPPELEVAKKVVASGGNSFKFALPDKEAARKAGANVSSLLDVITSPVLGFTAVLDLPLTRYAMWAYAINERNTYREIYDFTVYLLHRYQNTGKTFMLGHWEGDWSIRNANRTYPPTSVKVAQWIDRLSETQRAVDDAKADYPNIKDVAVWCYAEANKVVEALNDFNYISIITSVIPYVSPPIDYVSYSTWDILDVANGDLFDRLTPALNFMECLLPPKPCVPLPRVLVGEVGFPLFDQRGNSTASPEKQARRMLWFSAVSIAWGVPDVYYWAFYTNTHEQYPVTYPNGTVGYAQRGFWMVDDQGNDAPIFTAYKAYYNAARGYLTEQYNKNGQLPSDGAFRQWAVATLASMSTYQYPLPSIRFVS